MEIKNTIKTTNIDTKLYMSFISLYKMESVCWLYSLEYY